MLNKPPLLEKLRVFEQADRRDAFMRVLFESLKIVAAALDR